MRIRLLDTLARHLATSQPRRSVLGALVSLPALLIPVHGWTEAKGKKGKQKAEVCVDGSTLKVSKEKKKKLIKKGATSGACPSNCVPTCPGTTCGQDDGCGGTCGCVAGSLCHAGVCHACSVTCGAGGNCGPALQTALTGGGTVYACPGRYVGNFQLRSSVALIGAGEGSDPVQATIIDANGSGRPFTVFPDVNAALHGLRITGGNTGNESGGGLINAGNLTMTACTVHQNVAAMGAGFAQLGGGTGPVVLNSCHITENVSTKQDAIGGGILYFEELFTLTLNDTVVSGNKAGTRGGGGLALFGKLEARRTTISGNQATNGAGVGIVDGAATFDSACVIENNIASGDGGGIFINKGTLKLNGAILRNNVPNNCVGPGC